MQVREGAGATGCEERLRAAGGSVGPGGAREAARGDVSGGPAGSGRHFLYKGGRAGLRLPRAGVGLWAAGGGGRAAGGLSHRGAGLPARSQGCPFRRPGSRRRDICGAETWMCARARERKNGSAQTLRPGRGAGRGEGGAAGAERAERARSCLRAGLERARPAAGLGSRAVSALGRRKCAFAAGEGRRAAGVVAVMRRGGGWGMRAVTAPIGGGEPRAVLRNREHSAWGCPGEGCPRGQEEEGGRRQRGSRLWSSPAPGKRLARIPAPVGSVVFIRWLGHLDFLFSCPEAGCGCGMGVLRAERRRAQFGSPSRR